MRIFVDQHAISRNANTRDTEEPVFVVEQDDGTQTRVHGVRLRNARLRYDRTAQPRAWIEGEDMETDP